MYYDVLNFVTTRTFIEIVYNQIHKILYRSSYDRKHLKYRFPRSLTINLNTFETIQNVHLMLKKL